MIELFGFVEFQPKAGQPQAEIAVGRFIEANLSPPSSLLLLRHPEGEEARRIWMRFFAFAQNDDRGKTLPVIRACPP